MAKRVYRSAATVRREWEPIWARLSPRAQTLIMRLVHRLVNGTALQQRKAHQLLKAIRDTTLPVDRANDLLEDGLDVIDALAEDD
jgi:hypothetical protein